MRKYVYKNAIVYITEPTEAQIENIRKATERFVHKLAREGLLDNERYGKNNRRVSGSNSHARKRNQQIKAENK